ncbi:MAG: glycoside hydrolase family 3 N-terminal domain-containing protein, partial [Faecousia sp.]
KTTSKYVEYAEGIYVGYRYYETRYVDNTTGECDEAAYAEAVQYPFGYGLSYTQFTQELVSHKEENGNLITEVKVTNTGSLAGKEVVQLYFTAPYTVGGMEKAHVVLTAFRKTGLLEPGASETLTLSFSVEEMASYDYANNGAYVLDAGEYEIKLMHNSHDVIDSYTHTVEKTEVYSEGNPRSTDAAAAVNVFTDAAGDVTYVSRADWEGTLPTQRVESQEASDALLYTLDYKNINELYCSNDPEAEPVTTGAKNGLKLENMIGLSYEDEAWEALLDQLTVEEMSKLIGFGGFSTVAVSSVDKASTIDIDGPAGLNALTSDISGVQYPSEVVIASTFNVELVEEMGQVYAQEAHAHGVNGVYAPAANIHRTPFSGRNFEYYSEDPLLSGKIGAAEAKGLNELGICTYVKHFALNDQETNRSGVAVWSNEQAIREIYLKAFEYIVKEGGTDCIMTSYNRIGAVWAGGHSGLITRVLRGEWGFTGTVITDYDNGKYMNTDQVLRAGGDMMLSTIGHTPSEVTTQSNFGLQQMRRASKNILYTVVNSRAYTDPVTMGQPYWLYTLIAVNVLAFALLTLAVFKKTTRKAIQVVKDE